MQNYSQNFKEKGLFCPVWIETIFLNDHYFCNILKHFLKIAAPCRPLLSVCALVSVSLHSQCSFESA